MVVVLGLEDLRRGRVWDDGGLGVRSGFKGDGLFVVGI